MGCLLIGHYDHRMTKARDRASNIAEWIRTHAYMDIYATMGETEPIPSERKDTFERVFFYGAIGGSPVAVALALSLK
jgi:hypothetical protein